MHEAAPQCCHGLHEVFNGLRSLVRTGMQWRFLPNDLPPWPAVYQRTRRWPAAGCFEAVVHDLRTVLRPAERRAAEPTAAVLDSRTVQSTPESWGRAGYDGAERRRGTKVHAAVDTLGHLLALHATPADGSDRGQVATLAEAVWSATGGTVGAAFADQDYIDQDYTGLAPAGDAAAAGIRLEVVRCRPPSLASCCCRGAGWLSAASPGRPASAGSPATTSGCAPPPKASTTSPSLPALTAALPVPPIP